jgi:hypothetical protein
VRDRLLPAVLAVAAALAAAPAAAQTAPGEIPPPPTRRLWALGLDLGAALDDGGSWHYHQTVSAGVAWLWRFKVVSLVAAAETFDFDRFAFGPQIGISDIHSGLGAYAGASLDTDARLGLTVGAGWSLFYVEGQARLGSEKSYVVSAMLRIPVSVILYAVTGGI